MADDPAIPSPTLPWVTLCICTCQRPAGLARLLDAVADLDWEGRLDVVVVDNDAAGEGIALCRQRANGYRWRLTFGLEHRRGISFARNRAVTMALAQAPDFIAMLDDDEWPDRKWLKNLTSAQAKTDADAIGAPVLPVFDREPDDWTLHGRDCYGADLGLADGSRCMLYACGNFMARRVCFERLAPDCFDPAFAFSGGEDYVFFRRLHELGFRLHWSTQAIVYEQVPTTRLGRDWVHRHMKLKGNIQIRMFRLYDPTLPQEAWRWVKTCGLIATGTARYLAGLFHRPTRIRAALTLARALGRIQGHLGRTLNRPDHIEGI